MLGERWIILGDSIQARVYGALTITDYKKLTAIKVADTGIFISNLSSPGARMTDGGQAGFGAASNKNAIGMVVGFAGAKGIIITLGTNDWTNAGTTLQSYIDSYRSVIQYARGKGLSVVVVSPLWRSNQADMILHSDGSNVNLANIRYYTENVAWEEAAKTVGTTVVKVIQGLTAPLLPEHFADGLHLNALGHEAFSAWLTTKMQALGFW